MKVEIEGIIIHSVLWKSPTQIDLVISTGLSGGAEKKDIKITNPDGQIAVGEGLLQINKE